MSSAPALLRRHRTRPPAAGTKYSLGGRPLDEAIPAVVRGRIDHATGLLRWGEDPGHAVHEARKDIKRIRSALRLVRSSLGAEVYDRENEDYRAISRGLARFRDAEAMLEALDSLESWAGEPGRFAGLHAMLLAEHRAAWHDGSIRAASATAADRLDAAAVRMGTWDLPADPGDAAVTIGAGLQRAMRRGALRLERVEEHLSDERLHDWRKRAKDLWYQRALVGADAAAAERAHRLSSLLGDDHDLAVLREVVEANAGVFSWHGERERLIDLMARRRDRLQGRALELGRPLYAGS